MADKRPVFTENFSGNLTDIENFLREEGEKCFSLFFDRLIKDIVPTICRFPLAARPFLNRSVHSTQALELAEKLEKHLEEDDEIREVIFDAYLILYLVRGNRIVFLSIKHHRQLSYDLKRFWQD